MRVNSDKYCAGKAPLRFHMKMLRFRSSAANPDCVGWWTLCLIDYIPGMILRSLKSSLCQSDNTLWQSRPRTFPRSFRGFRAATRFRMPCLKEGAFESGKHSLSRSESLWEIAYDGRGMRLKTRCGEVGTPNIVRKLPRKQFQSPTGTGTASGLIASFFHLRDLKVKTKVTRMNAPTANKESPGTRIQRSVCMTGVPRNSELRAYQ
jgi:hypothetical protein